MLALEREPEGGGWTPLSLGPRLARVTENDAERQLLPLLLGSVDKLRVQLDSASIDRAGKIPADVLDTARRMGLFALTIGEEHGGLGLPLKAATAVIDQVARSDRSVAVMLGLHAGLGTRGLVQYGSSAQQSRWLPRLASGELVAAFAATEAGAGSDLMAVQTCGRGVAGGLRISGQKCYVTNGGFAGLYTLLVRTPGLGGERAQSLVCIERGAAGLHVGREEDKLGIRGSSTVTLELDEVFVPSEDVLGAGGSGSAQCAHVLAWGRTLMSAGCLGIANAAFQATLSHVATRRQFGRTLARMPVVQLDCADMAARLYAMESLVRWAADAEAEPVRLEALSTLAKVLCSESAFAICDRAIQLHGALGFLEPTGLPRLLRDCRITRIFEGANDVLLVRIGAAALASPRSELTGLRCADLRGTLADVARVCAALVTEREATLSLVRQRDGLSVMRKQALLWTLGQAEVKVHAAIACLARATAESSRSSLQVAEHAIVSLAADASAQLQVARDARGAAALARAQAICDDLIADTPAFRSSAGSGAHTQDSST